LVVGKRAFLACNLILINQLRFGYTDPEALMLGFTKPNTLSAYSPAVILARAGASIIFPSHHFNFAVLQQPCPVLPDALVQGANTDKRQKAERC
jgi:hypothetical protein